ncbi:hypothetical protein BD310DRAFT_856793 [Dichomitus squalens]|uniref:Alcohol acetyltransferase n=1 Tax=Dichomitus squalens TaxID=114155 RepID=A0A4Q9PMF6_9APHY|nr:hypothetical protein BD310DRAFT_856793 [Dichomitus squalens]
MEEPQWSILANSPADTPTYTRPLQGSELFADQVMLSQDGFGECCMGITFTTTLTSEELRGKTKEALARLRFHAPITAAALQAGIHDPQLRSWIYTPVYDPTDLERWVSEVLTVLDDPVDPSTFIQNMNGNKLPYVLPDGRAQYLRLYLMRPSATLNEFGFFFHGTHALMDAHPTIVALSLLLEYMTSADLPDIAGLSWGTEWENLPAGPITSTGGRRAEWDVDGNALMAKVVGIYSNPTPPHSLRTNLRPIAVQGRPRRLVVELTAGETLNILQALKRLGFSFTNLIEAAIALSIYKLNPVSSGTESEAHVTFGSSVISLGRSLVAPHASRGHFVSRFVLVPVSVPWRDISGAGGEKARLLIAMEKLKEQYTEYLSNPCTPQLMAEQMRLAPPRDGMPMSNPYVSTSSNLGKLEGELPVLWSPNGDASAYRESDAPLFRVGGLHFGHRLTLPTLMMHSWTIHSRLFIQAQALDCWDEDILQKYMQEIVRSILMIAA